MSLSVGSWHCGAQAHRVELADDAIMVAINPTCCDAAALSMSKKFSAQGNNYSGKFSKVSCQWSTLKCPHWSIRVPIQLLFYLLRTDKMERKKKQLQGRRFYSLISYSKAEKFNITSFFRSTEQWIRPSHLIPLMIEPVLDTIPYQNPLWPGQKSV